MPNSTRLKSLSEVAFAAIDMKRADCLQHVEAKLDFTFYTLNLFCRVALTNAILKSVLGKARMTFLPTLC